LNLPVSNRLEKCIKTSVISIILSPGIAPDYRFDYLII
jgi:hypothetical protein